MKAYRDVFGNTLPKTHVAAAARLVAHRNKATALLLTRHFGWGYGKCARLIEVLEDAGVIGTIAEHRIIILKNEDAAVNAALRQLRKGKPNG